MTNQEVIETIKVAISEVEWNYPMEYAVAFERAIEALEKQIPKKYEVWNGQDVCPNCNKLFGADDVRKMVIKWEMPYCKYCGQA